MGEIECIFYISTKKYYNLQDVEIHTAWMLRKYIEQGITPDFKMMNYEERIKFVESERKKRLLYISATNTSNKLKSIKKEYRKTKKYIHLTIEERNEFISEIARAISNWYDSFTFAYCIDKSAFGMEPPKYPPYEEAFMMITTSFQRFLEEKNEQGLIIQDNNENMKRRLHSLSKFFHKKGTLFTKLNNIVETPLFVDSEITTMIQIADIVSYGIRRYLDNNENNIFSYIYRRAYGIPPDKLAEKFEEIGERKFRAKQIMKWLYAHDVFDFYQMTDIPVDVSSQVGCKFGCKFCATGKLGFSRNLSSTEIIGQIYEVKKYIEQGGNNLTNIVFMGMGEPLDNLDAVVDSIKVLTADVGFGIGHRKILVSTVGIPEKIEKLMTSGVKPKLAISLNAPNNRLRSKIMPISKKYPIESLFPLVQKYYKYSKRWVTFEYVMFAGVNDSLKFADELVRSIKDLPVKVNLIPFNEVDGIDFKRPDDRIVLRFQSYLLANSIVATIRQSKGRDISGACGQLAGKEVLNSR